MARDKRVCYVGVDVGGTNIQSAVTDGQGEVLQRSKGATPREAGPNGFADHLAEVIMSLAGDDAAKGLKLASVGVGLPGPVDAAAGILFTAPALPALRNVPLRDLLQSRTKAPVFLGNDVNLGTLGEKWRGAARDADTVVGIFPGTGIGGGIVLDGKVWHGVHGTAAEVGHIIVQLDGPQCGCGDHGCAEALASRTALEKQVRQAVADGRETLLTEICDIQERIGSGRLRRALEAEDALTVELMTRASEVLGQLTKSLRRVIDPDVVVLGGGVIEACGTFMLPIIERIVADDPLLEALPPLPIVEAQLGDDAVMMGAVALAADGVGAELADPDLGAQAPPKYREVVFSKFGEARVGDKKHTTDLVIRANGKVRRRKKKLARELFGTSHRIGVEEVRRLCDPPPDTLVIGTGHHGMAQLDDEARAHLEAEGIAVEVHPSAEAAEVFNRLEGTKCLLLHVTC